LEHNIQLNPKTYVFGVTLGKLLGFIISKKRIKADPNKIKMIVNMAPPSNIKQLQSLQGKLHAINHFIAIITK